MSKVIKRLYADHQHISKLMQLIEIEIVSFNKGGTVDYELVEDILRYMVTYADRDHHPAEDLICKKLMEIDIDAAVTVGDLGKSHDKLTLKGKRFLGLVRQVVNGAFMSRDWFITTASEYLNSLSSHMKHEELVMFPLSVRLLSDQDWEEIESTVDLRPDPLVGENTDQGFDVLRQKIKSIVPEYQVAS